jgi:hypothetical protein
LGVTVQTIADTNRPFVSIEHVAAFSPHLLNRIAGVRLAAFFAGAAIMLCGCSSGDTHSFIPAFLGSPAPKTQQADADPEPDIAPFIRANIGTIFDPSAKARNISITQPRRGLDGYGWTICVKASLHSVGGAAIGQRTYFVVIKRGKIDDRRMARPEDRCAQETFQPL